MRQAHHVAAVGVVVAVKVFQSHRLLVGRNGVRHEPTDPDEQTRCGYRQHRGRLAFGGQPKRESRLTDAAHRRKKADSLDARLVEC